MRAVFKLRDAIVYVRNPFISLNEMQVALQEHGHDSSEYEDKAKTNRAVYSSRWKKVREAWTNLEVELIEAEVSWGIDATNISQPLIDLAKKLFVEIQRYLDDDAQTLNRKLIYNHGSFDNPDDFSKEVYQAINKIRQYLQPHLL